MDKSTINGHGFNSKLFVYQGVPPIPSMSTAQAAADYAAAAAVEGTAVACWTQGVTGIDQAPGKATAAHHVAPPGAWGYGTMGAW